MCHTSNAQVRDASQYGEARKHSRQEHAQPTILHTCTTSMKEQHKVRRPANNANAQQYNTHDSCKPPSPWATLSSRTEDIHTRICIYTFTQTQNTKPSHSHGGAPTGVHGNTLIGTHTKLKAQTHLQGGVQGPAHAGRGSSAAACGATLLHTPTTVVSLYVHVCFLGGVAGWAAHMYTHACRCAHIYIHVYIEVPAQGKRETDRERECVCVCVCV